ncbi:MAG: transposon-transfer assisting family protein [Bilifractor sp.]|nr:transposon-transfer assisting family protein [Bilifractor sp.]
MEWNQDEEILLMLYGENSLQDTIIAMKKVQGKLQADETDLDQMLAGVIGKLQQISEQEFESIGVQEP